MLKLREWTCIKRESYTVTDKVDNIITYYPTKKVSLLNLSNRCIFIIKTQACGFGEDYFNTVNSWLRCVSDSLKDSSERCFDTSDIFYRMLCDIRECCVCSNAHPWVQSLINMKCPTCVLTLNYFLNFIFKFYFLPVNWVLYMYSDFEIFISPPVSNCIHCILKFKFVKLAILFNLQSGKNS